MNRSEAVQIIQNQWKGEKDEAAAEKYLDRLIDLFEPELDPLKTSSEEVGGTKREHFRHNVFTFWKNEHGGF